MARFIWMLMALLMIGINNPARSEGMTRSFPSVVKVLCGDRAGLVSELGEKYGESQGMYGRNKTGSVLLEVYINPDKKTFTIFTTTGASGTSCVLASGFDLTIVEQKETSY